MLLLSGVALLIPEPNGKDRRHGNTDCDDVDHRPDFPREMHSKDWIVHRNRDPQPPDPTLMSRIKCLESQIREDTAADPSVENVVPIRILWVEGPEQHQARYELWNPDSLHAPLSYLSARVMEPIRLPNVMIVSSTSSMRGPCQII